MLGLSYREEYELIKSYNEEYPTFLPWEYVLEETIPITLMTALGATVLSIAILGIVAMTKKGEKATSKENLKAVYQLTNGIVNISLCAIGAYHYVQLPPDPYPFEDLMMGRLSLVAMAGYQIGYNLWALPFGIFLVDETPAMLFHHVAVIFVAGMPGFFTIGIRYYAPLFFGVIEGSSVPLALMNAFKERKSWRENYPGLYKAIRYVFAITFLYLRWYLYFQHKFNYLRLEAFCVLTAKSWLISAYFTAVFVSAAFIALLQVYWGLLIVKGLVKSLMPSKRTKKKEE